MTLELIIALVVYIISIVIVYGTFCDRLKELETEYRLNYARMCSTFTDAMTAISKALDTDELEPEQPTLGEWAETLCEATGCEFITDNGCRRTDEDYDGTCPCDIDGANK